jgi:inward rectifier potassium channel
MVREVKTKPKAKAKSDPRPKPAPKTTSFRVSRRLSTSPIRNAEVEAKRPDILVVGAERRGLTDLYHQVLTMPPWGLPVLLAAAYLLANVIFAGLYMLTGGVDGMAHGSFADAFFFSVQTLSTIGYGGMIPKGVAANVVVTIEAFFGLGLVAVTTGLIFARFSRATARVVFSRVAVITNFEGVPTLMFRAANQRGNQILEAEVMLSLLRQIRTSEGHVFRRFQELKVERARSPMFALTWTVMHTIDESSPLHGATFEDLEEWQAEIVIVLSGADDIFAQRIHARHSYLPDEIMFNQRFEDVLSVNEDGNRIIDYGRLHDVRDE